MEIHSSAFQNGVAIPSLYTCDGQNISPPLEWSGAPNNTISFVIIIVEAMKGHILSSAEIIGTYVRKH